MSENSQDRLLEIVERYFGIVGVDAEALLADLDTIHVSGGDWLIRQGAAADALYFLVRGRLQVWMEADAGDDQQQARLLGEIAPGESVGEIGLLTGGVRTAGVRAIRDSLLLRLDRDAFERFAADHPSLTLQLAGSVATRLVERTQTESAAMRNLTTVVLLPLQDSDWLDDFYERLDAELSGRCSTLCLTSRNLGRHGAPVDNIQPDGTIPDSLKHWLDARENGHRLVLYVADPEDTDWSRLCLRQADIVFLLADAAGDPRPRDWERKLLESPGQAVARHALLLRHPVANGEIRGTRDWLVGRDLDFHLHLRTGHHDEVAKIARMLTGEAVGLVLGGGAARGFAEIGAYRAICEAGVPVDWVGGSSIGGIIGAGIALDRGPDYVADLAREAFVKGKPFGDYTIPILSLLRGKRMESLTKEHLEGEIEDLPIPYFCISSRLDSGEMHVHERGPIWHALRATAALPGMLPPAVVDNRLVVDGGVVNNLPVDIMRTKLVGRVIAVDVSSRRMYKVRYDEVPSPWSILGKRLMPGARPPRVPSVVSVLMKAAEVGTMAKVRELGRQADLLLQPPVSQFGLTDVKSFDQIVEAGYQHTRERLADWSYR